MHRSLREPCDLKSYPRLPGRSLRLSVALDQMDPDAALFRQSTRFVFPDLNRGTAPPLPTLKDAVLADPHLILLKDVEEDSQSTFQNRPLPRAFDFRSLAFSRPWPAPAQPSLTDPLSSAPTARVGYCRSHCCPVSGWLSSGRRRSSNKNPSS